MRFVIKKHLTLILLAGIIVLGAFFRLYQLSSIPTGFFCDEASIGYNAYTILTQGKDEYGVVFPVFFKAFGEYKDPIEIYSTVPSIAIFGLNEFAIRFTSAVYGILCLVVIFLLTRELFPNQKYRNTIALVSTLFLAVSPWHIHMSRISMEGIIPYVLFAMLGTYFFLVSLRRQWFFLAAGITFSIGMYTYFPSRLFIPVLAIILLAIYCKQVTKNIKILLLTVMISFLILSPYIPTIFNGSVIARWQQVSIFSQPPQHESVLTHIVINYIRHFSPDFLFFKGDAGMPGQFITRQSLEGMGELYLLQLPFILFGIFFSLKNQRKEGILLVLWLLVYPLGSMFTVNDSPTATRSIIGVVPFNILSGIGVYAFMSFIRRKIGKDYAELGWYMLLGVLAISVYYYAQAYFIKYPLYSSDFWGWQYGAKPIVQYFVKHEHQYDQLYMEGAFNAPYIFFDFYAPHDCSNCSVGDPKTNFDPTKKQLFAITPQYMQTNPIPSFHIDKTVYYPNGSPAFLIGEIVR